MRPQEEIVSNPRHVKITQPLGELPGQQSGSASVTVRPAPQHPPAPPAAPPDSLIESTNVDEWSAPGRQDVNITAILHMMSLGHLWLGLAVALAGILMEVTLHQPASFGLTASGGMLCACGLITLLAASRRRATQSPLAFYLLPYADFAIIGLWLLLFGISGPIALFYTYVVVSAALLLGSRHAITLAGISGATMLTITLGQYEHHMTPAITLPQAAEAPFTAICTVLALGVIAYAASLFSINLDRFIIESNRQNEAVVRARIQIANHHEQTRHAMETLSDTYMRFMEGDIQARAPLSTGPLALTSHLLNTLLDQVEHLLRASSMHTRMEARIGELTLALDRLSSGDMNALQVLASSSGTPLDTMKMALTHTGRQLILLQQALQRSAAGYTAVTSIASDLALLHQALKNTDSALHDLQTRAAQSASYLHTLLDGESGYSEGLHNDRPFLREMELRARQQSAGIEMLHARLGHIGSQLEAVEAELRRIAEGMEQITRAPHLPRTGQPGPNPPEHQTVSGTLLRSSSGPLQRPDTLSSPNSGPLRPASGSLRPSDALPRRFSGPLTPSGYTGSERPGPWQASFGRAEDESNALRH
jgi:hypothetical protein